MQSKFLVANHDGVAGVVTTLVANHVINAVTQKIGCFTFALVAPLGSN